MQIRIGTRAMIASNTRLSEGVKDGAMIGVCLLCRVIGHRWTDRLRYSVDGCKMDKPVERPNCARCGALNPMFERIEEPLELAEERHCKLCGQTPYRDCELCDDCAATLGW